MKFVKNPIEIEAKQFTHDSKDHVYYWASEIQQNVQPSFNEVGDPVLLIPTLEGEMICSLGDWIIVEPFPTDWRRLYPCKPEIFEKTYSQATGLSKDAREAIIKRSIEIFGVASQIDQVHEEIGELIVAINHYKRKRCTIKDLVIELADVRMMLELLQIAFNIDGDTYNQVELSQWSKWDKQLNEHVRIQELTTKYTYADGGK